MKKLTIFRNGEAELSRDYLLRRSAYQIYAHTKELVKKEGAAGLIITSHVPRATQTAKIIGLVLPQARIVETAFLSHYYAGTPSKFIKSFKNSLPVHIEHVILVSHMMNIGELAHCYVPRGGSVTLEAENWEDVFKPKVSRRQVNEYPMDDKESDEIIRENGFSWHEKEMLTSLPFIVD